jgi:5-methylcytosine-specific restriction endonuclease McrA
MPLGVVAVVEKRRVGMSPIDVSSSRGVSRPTDSTSRLRKLSCLSDRELLSRVKDLVTRERAVTLEILFHLIEVERRRLHLGLGYASMFDYCTRHLRYSSSAASRRIQSARCIRDYPDIYELLERNEINLVTISLVASILNESNAKDLLSKIRGKSQREVEAIASAYRPPVALRDRAKPVWVALPEPVEKQSIKIGHDCPITPTAGSVKTPNPAAADFVVGPPQAIAETQAQLEAAPHQSKGHRAPSSRRLEERALVQFVASKRFMQKFEKARALLSNGRRDLSYEAVLEAALDEFLKDHDPEERKKRREERKEKARVAEQSSSGRTETSRYISKATRDAVFARDKGRCAYIGANGERCSATHHLQVDHVIPYARGGTNAVDNLRLLCERHNKLEAERLLGANTVRRVHMKE